MSLSPHEVEVHAEREEELRTGEPALIGLALLTGAAAARLLPADPDGLPGAQDLAALLARLLTAVGSASNAGALPPALRRAAVEIAEQVVARSAIPVQRGDGEAEPRGRGHSPATGADRRPVPFSSSIQLGRMG